MHRLGGDPNVANAYPDRGRVNLRGGWMRQMLTTLAGTLFLLFIMTRILKNEYKVICLLCVLEIGSVLSVVLTAQYWYLEGGVYVGYDLVRHIMLQYVALHLSLYCTALYCTSISGRFLYISPRFYCKSECLYLAAVKSVLREQAALQPSRTHTRHLWYACTLFTYLLHVVSRNDNSLQHLPSRWAASNFGTSCRLLKDGTR